MKNQCEKCAYSCIEDVDAVIYHTLCLKGNCIICNNICKDFKEENNLSRLIRNGNCKKDIEYLCEEVLDDIDTKDLIDIEEDFSEQIINILSHISLLRSIYKEANKNEQ